MQLFLHWFVTVIVLIAPPPGPAYNFIVNLYVVMILSSWHFNLHLQIHIPRCLDQHLCFRRPNLPTAQQIRELVLALANISAGSRHLPVPQHLPRRYTIYPAKQRLECRRLPVLRLPPCRHGGAGSWSWVLAAVDKSPSKMAWIHA
jgi:hypothetical protein